MAVTPLEAIVRHRDRAAIIDLRGEIDSRAQDAVAAAYEEAIRREPAAILLNFGDVPYLNSKAVALTVALLALARRCGRRLLAFGLTGHAAAIFQVTRLSDYIGVYPDEAHALASVSGAPYAHPPVSLPPVKGEI